MQSAFLPFRDFELHLVKQFLEISPVFALAAEELLLLQLIHRVVEVLFKHSRQFLLGVEYCFQFFEELVQEHNPLTLESAYINSRLHFFVLVCELSFSFSWVAVECLKIRAFNIEFSTSPVTQRVKPVVYISVFFEFLHQLSENRDTLH